ncbi:MAG TPA: hypothetical protein VJU61_10480 [Polyangiaceae bacterium]|nr:hypothetical protein [Polyangiaceae bacterium]
MTSSRWFSFFQSCQRGCRIALPALVLSSAVPVLAEDGPTSSGGVPLCVGAEPSTWYHPDATGSPAKIVVRDACGMPYDYFVLMYDAFGHVADSPADFVLSYGRTWLRVEPWSDGDYIENVWVYFESEATVRVWISYEALDGSGDFVTDVTYSKNPPQLGLSRERGELLEAVR